MSIFSNIFSCSRVMDANELRLRKHYAALTTAKLREIKAIHRETSAESSVLHQVLYEREFWRKFLTSGIVAWFSLGVAIYAAIHSHTHGH